MRSRQQSSPLPNLTINHRGITAIDSKLVSVSRNNLNTSVFERLGVDKHSSAIVIHP